MIRVPQYYRLTLRLRHHDRGRRNGYLSCIVRSRCRFTAAGRNPALHDAVRSTDEEHWTRGSAVYISQLVALLVSFVYLLATRSFLFSFYPIHHHHHLKNLNQNARVHWTVSCRSHS